VTLVAAFRATLEELEVADILIHVLDISHKRGFEQGVSVQKTLEDLKLTDKPTITALNKVDRLAGVTALIDLEVGVVGDEFGLLAEHYPNAVPVSAAKGWNLERLVTEIEGMVVPATL
jgi:GTP-binding protein HflX